MKKKTNIILCSLILGLLVATMQADASEFALSQTKIVANIGETVDLDVTGTDKTPVWTSYNVNTAKVNSDGEVTALRKGKTTISARVGITRKTCAVSVVDSSVKLNKTAATIYVGGTSTNYVQLKATVKGATKNVIWTSSNESVATVDKNGKVTSVSAGTAVITATANGKSASCTVTVKLSSTSLNMDTMQLSTKGTGSSMKLVANVVGSSKTVKWTSSDKTIATVSGGKVTGKKTGTATITATANGVSATCKVNVLKDSISINEEKVLLYVGGAKTETNQLKTNAGKKDVVTWASSDVSVVTVDTKGLVTAIGEGTAIISAGCNGTTDTCEVTVKKTDTIVNEDNVLLKTKGDNKTYALNFSVIGRNNSVKWTSSDKNIATVSNGKLTAKKAGTATITATANGVSDTVQVTVKDFDPTIKLNQSEYALYTGKGNTVTLKATVDGNSKKVTWNSSNTAVATVNNGKVTAVGEGKAVITATANGVTAECIITVKETAVNLARTNITLSAGKTEVIPVDVVGVSQAVKWTSTNTKIVTVKNGTITAKKNGEADIKATANNVTAVCHVVVGDCEHNYVDKVTKEPTCSTVGEKTFTCSKCGDTYTETIATIPHSYEEVVTAPTCTEKGYTTHTCKYCGDSYVDTYTEATGHDWGEWVTVKEATNTEEGEKVHTCKKCGVEESVSIPVGTHVHSYTQEVIAPTCTEQGYTLYICECGDTYKDNYVDATGHSYEADKVVEPTCTEQGYTEYKCSVCGNRKNDNSVDALGHSYGEGVITTEATCIREGVKTYTCSRCNDVHLENLGYGEHKTVDTVIEPTCKFGGHTQHKCSVCGKISNDNYVDALGHSYDEGVITTEATCLVEGVKTYTCTRCNETSTENLGYAECNMEEVVTEPTCSSEGYVEKVCSVCGYNYIVSYIDALGHSYDKGVVTKEPTCKDFGEMTYTCTREGCDDSYTESILPTYGKHKYEVNNVVQPTCTEKGYTEYKCSVCDDTYTDDETEPLGHEKGSEIDKVYASKEGRGYTTYSCGRCNVKFEDDYIEYQPTEEQVHNDIIAFENEYPTGTEWDEDNVYDWKGGMGGGNTACIAFAKMLSDEAFGYLQAHETDISNIRVGDIILNDHHAGIVLEIDDAGGVYTAEGNVNGKVTWQEYYPADFIGDGKYWNRLWTRYPE